MTCLRGERDVCAATTFEQEARALFSRWDIQVPFEVLAEVHQVFLEGEARYGRDNWKSDQPDTAYPDDAAEMIAVQHIKSVVLRRHFDGQWGYQRERDRHALIHLARHSAGDTGENHLAKIGWWAAMTMWRRKHGKTT